MCLFGVVWFHVGVVGFYAAVICLFVDHTLLCWGMCFVLCWGSRCCMLVDYVCMWWYYVMFNL